MRWKTAHLFIVATMVPLACTTPMVSDRTAEPLVVTKYDTTIDFGSFSTFAINPTVSLVTDIGDAGVTPLAGGDQIVASVASHLEERGYTRVDATERPDLGIVVTAFLHLRVETTVSPGLWFGTPGYAAPPSYFGYPGGFYDSGWGYQSTAYKNGTLIIDMFDLKDPGRVPPVDAGLGRDRDAGGIALESIWVGLGHGSVNLGGTFGPDVLQAVDQVFAQSPYLTAQ